jgi:lipoprotein-anchoring transpeptidase ErfK/SrfK
MLLLVLAAAGIGAAAPTAGRAPAVVAPRVVVGDVFVGRLASEQARARLRWAYERPLRLVFGSHRWWISPARFGVDPDVGRALADALHAAPGARVPLRLSLDAARVRAYVHQLDARFSYAAVDARAYLQGLTPAVAEGRPGLRIRVGPTVARIERALRSGIHRRVAVASETVAPAVTASDLGPVVVIRRGSNELYLYDESSLVRTFKVATGQPQYPTPLGDFSIVDMQRNPWWRPPDSAWAKGLKPIPPGPGNPLGTRWMGLSAPGVGMHGTPDAASIGYSASHGCIRMYVPDAEWLFDHVHVGTPVFIVGA